MLSHSPLNIKRLYRGLTSTKLFAYLNRFKKSRQSKVLHPGFRACTLAPENFSPYRHLPGAMCKNKLLPLNISFHLSIWENTPIAGTELSQIGRWRFKRQARRAITLSCPAMTGNAVTHVEVSAPVNGGAIIRCGPPSRGQYKQGGNEYSPKPDRVSFLKNIYFGLHFETSQGLIIEYQYVNCGYQPYYN